MKVGWTRQLLQLIGRAFDIRHPARTREEQFPSVVDDSVTPDTLVVESISRWSIERVGLRAGWYMLEIEHSQASIGCILSLEYNYGCQERLLLTSKPICKRIVRLQGKVSRYTLSIDQSDCTLQRVSLVGLSQKFAVSRMRKTLESRGGVEIDSAIDANRLYSRYDALICSTFSRQAYQKDTWNNGQGNQRLTVFRNALSNSLLILHRAPDDLSESVDPSVDSAIEFAQGLGWQVAWHPYSNVDSSGKHTDVRVFHLLIDNAAEYRIDVFHQMMSSIDEQTVLIYADHDHVDDSGHYFDPVLKPEWNPDLLLSANYIQLPWMIRESWLLHLNENSNTFGNNSEQLLLSAALGMKGRTPTGDGSFDADIESHFSKIQAGVEALSRHHVKRIPIVLASVKKDKNQQRVLPILTAKTWQQRVQLAISKAGYVANVTQDIKNGICRISRPLPTVAPMVDIIIPTRDKKDVLEACIDSVIERTDYPNYRILVVDNDSKETDTENYYSRMLKDKRIRLLRYVGSFNYSAINNYAVAESDAPILVLLNNDTEVISRCWLDELVGHAVRKDIGCVGAKLYYSNGRVQHGGVIVGITGVAGHAHRYSDRYAKGYCNRLVSTQNMSAVTGACLAIKRKTFMEAGGLDQECLGVAWNDVDLCLKVQQLGYRNLWTPYAELFHHEGLSRGADDTREKIERVDSERRVMIDRWKLDTYSDPAYHPSLTRHSENFVLNNASL